MKAIEPFDIVIYHGNCYDGMTAAWAARKMSPGAAFVPASYGEGPPDCKGKRVVVVDFSYPRDVLLAMHAEAAALFVLDHHKTAAEDLAGLEFAIFDMDRSGAGLAWDELIGGPRPPMVEHVEDRDLWRFEYADTKAYHAAMTSFPMTFEAWDEIASIPPDDMVAKGQSIEAYHYNTCKKFAARAGLATLAGVDVWATNIPVEFVSETADILKDRTPHMPALGWAYDAQRGDYYCSIRSRADGPDVSEIARKFGGGGHRNAAGFRLAAPPEVRPAEGVGRWQASK